MATVCNSCSATCPRKRVLRHWLSTCGTEGLRPMTSFGFAINNRTCIGCHACSTACKAENDVPLGVSRTWVKYTEVGTYPDVRRNFQVTRCNHCQNPPCVRICPVSAMYQRRDGIVEFDQDQCIGCKACMQACPYDAIHIDPDSGTAAKCHYCAHRVDLGLEPACVVVCPEHAIIAGDLSDPTSEISRVLAGEQVSVRKPEQGTIPKLFYVDGSDFALTPTGASSPETYMWADRKEGLIGSDEAGGSPVSLAGHMVQVGYNVQHAIPWHWPVPAYLVTKGIGGGVVMVLALGLLLGIIEPDPGTLVVGGLLSLLMLAATTALLVYDLERPERFLWVLLRPQWRSWLTRGAYLLVGLSAVVTVWWGTELMGYLGLFPVGGVESVRMVGLWLGLPLALGAIVYTAYLFGQAEGRDLWQSSLLPLNLIIQAALVGSGALLILTYLFGLPGDLRAFAGPVFWGSLAFNAAALLLAEVSMPAQTETAERAHHRMLYGPHARSFWLGGIGLGLVLPALLMAISWPALAAMAAMTGLYFYEHAFVMAAQEIPNS